MSRYHFLGRAVDTYGNAQPNIGVTVNLANTLTRAIVYVNQTGGVPTSAAPQITTDAYGRFSFWVDTDNYAVTQFFDITAEGLTYEDIDIFRGFRDHGLMTGLADDDHPQYSTDIEYDELVASYNAHAASAGVHFTEASIDHGSISGLADDDHPQYMTDAIYNAHAASASVHFTEASIDHANIQSIGSTTHTEIDSHIASAGVHFTEASIDHGSIVGLGDDDHIQYALVNGTRNFTGNEIFEDGIEVSGAGIFNNNVGIGTKIPSGRLHLNGTVGTLSGGIVFGDGDSGIYEESDDELRVISNAPNSAASRPFNVLWDVNEDIPANADILTASYTTSSGTVLDILKFSQAGTSAVIDTDKTGWGIQALGDTKIQFLASSIYALYEINPLADNSIDLGGSSKRWRFGWFGSGVLSPGIYSSNTAGADLTISSTYHATKGKILFGTSAYDEVNNRLGIGTANPDAELTVSGSLELSAGVPVNYISDSATVSGSNQLLTALAIHQAIDNNVASIVTDHGGLTGLEDDDHPQYTLNATYNAHAASASVHFTGASLGIVFTEDADGNIIGGTGAGSSLVGGSALDNFTAGVSAGMSLTTGDQNIAIGNSAMLYNETGSGSVAIGKDAGKGVSGQNYLGNVFIGYQAATFNKTGFYNTVIGWNAVQYNESGSYNVAIGSGAGTGVTGNSHSGNTFVGYQAGNAVTTGGSNVALGNAASLFLTTGAGNVTIGSNAGYRILDGISNVVIGQDACRGWAGETFSNNTVIGFESGYQNFGDDNVFIGYQSARWPATGVKNVVIGSGAGFGVWPDEYSNSVFIGYQSGFSMTTGTDNVFIGYQSGYSEIGSNKLYIENSNSATPLIYGEFDNDLVRINGYLELTGSIELSGGVVIDDVSNSATVSGSNQLLTALAIQQAIDNNVAAIVTNHGELTGLEDDDHPQYMTDAIYNAHAASASVHFTEASIDHANIQSIGTLTHTELDSHVASAGVHFTEASIDHGSILGLGDDDHPMYTKQAVFESHVASAAVHFIEADIDHANIQSIGTNTHTEIDSHIASAGVHFTEASIDHGSISGLEDDDHPQYMTDAIYNAHAASASVHFTEASIDHGSISGLEDDDHPQYMTDAIYNAHAASASVHFTEASIDHANIQSIGTLTHTELDSHVASASVHFTEGSITHDNLNAVDSGTYRHLSAAQVTDLTDGGDTTLHDHDGISENTVHRGSDGADHSRVVTNSQHVSGVGDDHTQYVLADGSRDITGNQTFEAGITLETQPSGVDQAVPRNYIESRLQNLITNGSGLLESNYNFLTFTFDPAETHGGGGSFLYSGVYSGGKEASEFIPIDGDKYYRMVQWCMSGDTGGGNFNAANRQYSGISPYDIDGLQIKPWMYSIYSGSNDTTLAAELNDTDLTITLTDATGWCNSGATYQRQLVWYDYENGKGYTYPDYTYTRNGSYLLGSMPVSGAWADAGITGNVITLTEPWSGGTVPSGSAVRNCTSGGTYKYISMSNVNVPNAWTRYEGYIGSWDTNGDMNSYEFPYGTAFIRPMWLPNYTDGTGNNFRFSDLWFSEMSARNLEDATNAVKGVATAAQITDLEANTSARHTAGTDTTLGTMTADIDMDGSYQVVGLQAPANAGEALRQTVNITEADLEQLTDGSDTTLHDHDGISENTAARHTAGTDTTLGTMTADIDMDGSYQVVGLQAPAGAGEALRQTVNITEADLEQLTDGSDTTLHDHDGISENTSDRHTQDTDTDLGAVGAKNPPIDADKAIYRDSTDSDALVTSTWTQVKAFLKTYQDTLYSDLAHAARHTDGNDDIQTSSISQKGIVEVATSTETNTGTDAARAVSPDGLAGSVYGERCTCMPIFDSDTAVAAGNGVIAFCVPASLDGFNLVDVTANVDTASSSGTVDIQVRRRRATTNADMLTVKVTIAVAAYFAADGTVNGANDDITTGDKIYIDVDADGTGTKGLSVTMTFRKP